MDKYYDLAIALLGVGFLVVLTSEVIRRIRNNKRNIH